MDLGIKDRHAIVCASSRGLGKACAAALARELRAQGSEEAKRIRAKAEREREIILAEADRDSQQIRGQGDARAAEIYAKAYNENPEFFALSRSLNAYKNTFTNRSDILLLQPDSDFFQYFRYSRGPAEGQ